MVNDGLHCLHAEGIVADLGDFGGNACLVDESLGVAGEASARGDSIELSLVAYPDIACDEQDRSTLKADSQSETQLTQTGCLGVWKGSGGLRPRPGSPTA